MDANATNVTTDADATARARLDAVLARAYRFRDRGLATSFAHRGPARRMSVMLGDDERYWVVTPADASRLERMGYGYAD